MEKPTDYDALYDLPTLEDEPFESLQQAARGYNRACKQHDDREDSVGQYTEL